MSRYWYSSSSWMRSLPGRSRPRWSLVQESGLTQLRARLAGDVLPPGAFGGDDVAHRLLGLGVALFPIGLQRRGVHRVPAFDADDRVLHHDAAHALRMLDGEADADRPAVILHVEHVGGEAELVGEAFDHVGEVGEAVVERIDRRRAGIAEAGIVRRDHVILGGEIGDQVAKHVRGGGEAVQQQDGRRVRRAGLAIEDVEAVDRDASCRRPRPRRRPAGRRARPRPARRGGQEAMDFDHGGLRVLPFKQLFERLHSDVTCQ